MRTGSSAIGRMGVATPSASLDPAVDLREADALPQAPRPVDVQGEVAVAEAEPGRLAQPLQHRGRGPGLPGQAPAALAVGEAGQRVEHGVVVGADEEAVELRRRRPC